MSSTATAEPIALGPAPLEQKRDWRRPLVFVFAGFIYFFLYAPIIVMAIFSFNEGSVQSLPLKGFSTIWYDRLFNDSAMIEALIYSAKVSVIAVFVSCVAGTAFSILFTRARIRGLPILQALVALPFVMPGMVLGISLLLSLREIGVEPGLLAIVIGHIAFITPIIVFVVSQRLRALDPTLEQASKDLGANSLRTFVHITFPSIRTALIAAALLGFTVSFDEIIVTFFLSGPEQTLPVHIWTLLRQGFSPAINAVLTMIAVFSILTITIATVTIARSRRKEV
jgi:spermidine/putrescine transport system permease protein